MEDESILATVIDIEKLQNSLKLDLDHHRPSNDLVYSTQNLGFLSDHQHICRVHINYNEPTAVSVGLYHSGMHNLQAMERNKWYCLDFILKENPDKTIDDYLKVVWESYSLMRSYYGERIKMKSSKFVQMLLLDGCFILVYLIGFDWNFYNGNPDPENNYDDQQIFSWQYSFVSDDILLPGNQIPFFVLKRIYELVAGDSSPVLSDKFCGYIEKLLWKYPKAIKESERPKDFLHLLHLCHMYFRPSQLDISQTFSLKNFDQLPKQWLRAMHYEMAGVKFEKRQFNENNPHSLLDVKLSNNVMYIPYLPVDENTASLFKNLIAFENTSPQFGNDISAYVIFISQLVGDVKDVTLFVQKGIIGDHLGSEEDVLNVFKKLHEVVVFDSKAGYYLQSVYHSLDSCCQSRMKWWKGGLLQRGISTIHNWVKSFGDSK